MWVHYEKGKTRVPIKIWTEERGAIDDNCLEQAMALANLPYVHKHVALMPDTHMGMGMPIGGVIATHNVIIPNAVGSDVGCGMVFAILDLDVKDVSEDDVRKILRVITKRIPTGHKHRSPDSENAPLLDFNREMRLLCSKGLHEYSAPVFKKQVTQLEGSKVHRQLGTLGGGNHFIEIQEVITGKEHKNKLAIMIHSGSRNYGKQVNDYYHKRAVERGEKYWGSNHGNITGLPLDTQLGQDYLEEMGLALAFARMNREEMMKIVYMTVCNELGWDLADVDILFECNVHHNYAALEHHYGQDVWVHRKGAIRARKGDIGIIPSSMGTPSYIVVGKGNEESFNSASHGAGRKVGRRQAKETFEVDDFKAHMARENIQLMGASFENCLDESPFAYKDIDTVMENEKDLVDILYKVRPLGVIKGD